MAGSGHAASSATITVGATILSATTLDTTSCASGTPATQFGSLLPGASMVAAADCVVAFGSSNDTSLLSVVQADRAGHAMVRPTTGQLDTSFAGDGSRLTDVMGDDAILADGSDRLADGSVVIADVASFTAVNHAILSKIKPDGTVDTGFGAGDGVANFLPVGASSAAGYSTVGIAGGKLLVSGIANMGGATGNDTLVARLLPDGTLDPTFGTGGITVVSFSSSTDYASSIREDAQGRIVVMGAAFRASFDMLTARFLPNGTLDTSYGTAGSTVVQLDAADERATDMAIDGKGRAVAAFSRRDGDWAGAGITWRDIAAMRFTAEGLPDTTFGTGGLVQVHRDILQDHVYGMIVDHLDRPVLSGATQGASSRAGYVIRLRESDGVPDPTFGASGWAVYDPNTTNDYLSDVVELDDGSLAAIGYAAPDGAQFDTWLARFTSTGVPSQAMAAALPGHEYPRALHADGDGGLVVVGEATAANLDVLLVRFRGEHIKDFNESAASTWGGGSASLFGTCLRQLTGASVVGPWAVDGDGTCTAADADPWRAVPPDLSGVARTTVAGGTGTARLRYGMRVGASQPPGAYSSMVTMQVSAPG
ncbi:MAG: hypothetical protein JWM25_1876 [Thermoleophilia bacterium]|nr:hypothetical protein [Thermoleophilia bacterium]